VNIADNGTIRQILDQISFNSDVPKLILSIFILFILAKFLRDYRNDLRRGANLEVILALIITFLSIAGLVTSWLIPPFTLALLAVLFTGILKNTYILEKIEQKSHSRDVFLEAFDKREVNENVEHANEVIFLGTTLSNVVHGQYSRIEESLKKGNKIKILVVESNSNLCNIVARRFYEPKNGESIIQDLNSTIGMCRHLESIAKNTKGQLEIRLLDFLPSFGAIFVNPEGNNSKLYLWYYTYKTKNPTKPKMILRPTDERWYQLFKEMILALWNNAKPIPLAERD